MVGIAAIEASDDTGPRAGGHPMLLGQHSVAWSVPNSDDVICLTFDDGPDPEFTPRVLEILAEYDVKATFCMMGYNAEHHPDLARAVVGAGHEVANHTWTHRDLAFESAEGASEQIGMGKLLLTRVTGQVPRFFRPPRGELTGHALEAAARHGHDVLMYSMFGDIGGAESTAAVHDYVVSRLRPGLIIAFHDGIGRGTFDRSGPEATLLRARRHAEIKALPKIMDEIRSRRLRPQEASQALPRPRASTAI